MFIVCHSTRNVHSYVKMVTYTVILDITRMHFARVCAYSVLSNVAAAEDPCQIFTSNIEVVNILFALLLAMNDILGHISALHVYSKVKSLPRQRIYVM